MESGRVDIPSYSMYGLVVRSEVMLPLVPILGSSLLRPAWDFSYGSPGAVIPPLENPVAAIRCEHGSITCARYDLPDGTWIQAASLGTFHVASDGRRVDIYPMPETDELLLGHFLVGPVAAFVLDRLTYPSLHASAVVTEYGAVAFLGPKGHGKSTMAANFLRRGGELLTDDTLPLVRQGGVIWGMPGLATMKVWSETAKHTLGITDDLPGISPSLDKKVIALDGRYKRARQSVRLRALCVLNRYQNEDAKDSRISLEVLKPQQAVLALLAQASLPGLLLPPERARHLRLFADLAVQAPVYLMSFPDGFQHQEATRTRILAELQTLAEIRTT